MVTDPTRPEPGPPPAPKPAPSKCGQCGRSFAGAHGLQVHIARTHGSKATVSDPAPKTGAMPKDATPNVSKRSDGPIGPPAGDPLADLLRPELTVLIVRQDTPSGPELRLVQCSSAQELSRVEDLLEWLGVSSSKFQLEP